MEVKIIKATKENVKKANEFLTRLIHDEKKYDNNINEGYKVLYYYENMIDIDANCLLYATISNEIVGYLYGFAITFDESYFVKQARLEAMFVDEQYQGNKIGEKLVDEFIKWAKSKDVERIELCVLNGNKQALSLYKKIGFKTTKQIMAIEVR